MKKSIYFITAFLFVLCLHASIIPAFAEPIKIMPLGDSITWDDNNDDRGIGERVAYRYRLWQLLTNSGYEIDFVGSEYSGYDIFPDAENEGHPGWTAYDIVNGRAGSVGEGKLDEWLDAESPNIVLLHIGTNDISGGNEDWSEVEDILVVIDDYEFTSGKAVWVILALIIDRGCDPFLQPCPKSDETTAFNNDVEDFVFFPRQAGGDRIMLVDMQYGAGINYDRWFMGGDMWDNLHPFETGYAKMADVWLNAIQQIINVCTVDANLVIDNQVLSTNETFEACETITAGPTVNVTSPGDVTFIAGERVVLRDGFSVEAGGRFNATIDRRVPFIPPP